MGQRSQIYAIAKIGSRYRALAAIHHQWHYGERAVNRLETSLRTCSSPNNQPLLRAELAAAQLYAGDSHFWAPGGDEAYKDSRYTARFPFILTCLVVANSFDLEPKSGAATSNVIPLPFNTNPNEEDNNDGMTFIDITEPAKPRYCFWVNARFEREDQVETEAPLSAFDYLSAYTEDSVPGGAWQEKSGMRGWEMIEKMSMKSVLQPPHENNHSGSELGTGDVFVSSSATKAYFDAYREPNDLLKHGQAGIVGSSIPVKQIMWLRQTSFSKQSTRFADGSVDWSGFLNGPEKSNQSANLSGLPLDGATWSTAAFSNICRLMTLQEHRSHLVLDASSSGPAIGQFGLGLAKCFSAQGDSESGQSAIEPLPPLLFSTSRMAFHGYQVIPHPLRKLMPREWSLLLIDDFDIDEDKHSVRYAFVTVDDADDLSTMRTLDFPRFQASINRDGSNQEINMHGVEYCSSLETKSIVPAMELQYRRQDQVQEYKKLHDIDSFMRHGPSGFSQKQAEVTPSTLTYQRLCGPWTTPLESVARWSRLRDVE